jgi:hypothetical protein
MHRYRNDVFPVSFEQSCAVTGECVYKFRHLGPRDHKRSQRKMKQELLFIFIIASSEKRKEREQIALRSDPDPKHVSTSDHELDLLLGQIRTAGNGGPFGHGVTEARKLLRRLDQSDRSKLFRDLEEANAVEPKVPKREVTSPFPLPHT